MYKIQLVQTINQHQNDNYQHKPTISEETQRLTKSNICTMEYKIINFSPASMMGNESHILEWAMVFTSPDI